MSSEDAKKSVELTPEWSKVSCFINCQIYREENKAFDREEIGIVNLYDNKKWWGNGGYFRKSLFTGGFVPFLCVLSVAGALSSWVKLIRAQEEFGGHGCVLQGRKSHPWGRK